MDKFLMLFKVLQQGSSLAKSETWKNRQLAANALGIVLTAAVLFYPKLGLSNEEIQAFALALAVIGGLINNYLTVATTDKVGLPAPVELPVVELHEPSEAVEVPTEDSLDGGRDLLSGR